MISINSIAVLIFASSIIQDVVFCDEQQKVKNATIQVHDDGDKGALAVPADHQHQPPENVGKIWNWTFSSAGTHLPTAATNHDSKPKLEKEQRVRPTTEDAIDSNASASGFKKSFLRKAHLSDETAKSHPSIPLRNLEKLRDGLRRDGKAPSVERESNFDDFSNSFDSRDLSFDDDDDDDDDDESQSYGSWQLDDDDDLSDNEYFGKPSRTGVHQNYPASFSPSKYGNIPKVPPQRPAMQVRSVGMQPRSLQMRRSPVSRRHGRRGKNSVGM